MASKILIVRLSSLGDVIHTIPAQQELARQNPDASIHWLTEPAYGPLLECTEGIDRVWTVSTKSLLKGFTPISKLSKTLKSLRQEKFDLAIDIQGLLKSAVLARLSGAGRVIGFAGDRLREGQAAWFYHDAVTVEPGQRHQVSYNLDLIAPPRFKGGDSARIELNLPEEADQYVKEQLDALGISAPVILNPGGGWETKRWEPKRFADLAGQIERELGLPTLFSYGPGEENLLEEIRSACPVPFRSFPTDILQLAALCRQSRLFIAGDTGPLHLAVAMGTPAVAILGPAHAWRTGPFEPADEVVMHSEPCPHPYKRRCHNHFCMDIAVSQVFDAIVRRIGDHRPAPAP